MVLAYSQRSHNARSLVAGKFQRFSRTPLCERSTLGTKAAFSSTGPSKSVMPESQSGVAFTVAAHPAGVAVRLCATGGSFSGQAKPVCANANVAVATTPTISLIALLTSRMFAKTVDSPCRACRPARSLGGCIISQSRLVMRDKGMFRIRGTQRHCLLQSAYHLLRSGNFANSSTVKCVLTLPSRSCILCVRLFRYPVSTSVCCWLAGDFSASHKAAALRQLRGLAT